MRAEHDVRDSWRQPPDPDTSLYFRLGELLGLKSGIRSEVDLIARLERGLPLGAVQSLRTRAGLTDSEVYRLIASRRTLERREADRQPLTPNEADRAVRIARVTARAEQVFAGKPEYSREWLRTANPALDGRTPLEFLTSESGALAVEELLVGIDHGMFA